MTVHCIIGEVATQGGTMSQSPEIWRATYEATDLESLSCAYDEWAPDYERDTREHMGYVAPEVAGALLDAHLESRESKVLDAGCGTGLVGEALNKLGYSNIHAMDYCSGMLKEAERKQVYDQLIQADMSKTLETPDNSYDAAICVGAFTYAHLGPETFDELIRITKPEGVVCFTIRDGAYQKYQYRKHMLKLEAEKAWELQQMLDEGYLLKENVTAKFCAYRVLDS
ncbi:MAG: hypothetical protein PWQ57_2214 [Desulfovibrionales bacterium]|nr:hypothetical protein [Desulfovibrionales bacterium]